DEDQAPFECVPKNLTVGLSASSSRGGRIDEGNSNEEKKRRKDEISWSPAVPLGVHDRPIGVFITTGIVDDDHARNHQTAVDVEAKQTTREFGWTVEQGGSSWLKDKLRRCHAATICFCLVGG